MSDRVRLVIHGQPIPLERHRTGKGRTYLPARSKAYRALIENEWMLAGRPSLGTAPFALSARFYGANPRSDLDNLLKVIDALNGLAFADDSQLVCIAGAHKLPTDADGPRAEIDLWSLAR